MQMSLQTLALLGMAFSGLAQGHMVMTNPKPFNGGDNSPLAPDGSNFPCKKLTDATGISNTLPLGSTQTLKFMGSAVHGGGSCQVSITYDKTPTAGSTFKVIHSILGGCPARNTAGNLDGLATLVDPDTYQFTMPTNIPTGDAVLSWSWMNAVGNREFYQNCAPISITAATSKRDEPEYNDINNGTQLMTRDTSAYDALPDMLVVNLDGTNPSTPSGCQTPSGNLRYPNPGSSVEYGNGASAPFVDMTCVPKNGNRAGTNALSTVAAGSAAPAASSAPAAAKSSAPSATSAATVASSASPAGGVFATVSAAPVAQSSAASPVASSAAPIAPAVASSTPAASSGASSGASTGACTNEGAWVCLSTTSYQRCASGQWTAAMDVAGGTSCVNGTIQKRGIRFSGPHARRQAGLSRN